MVRRSSPDDLEIEDAILVAEHLADRLDGSLLDAAPGAVTRAVAELRSSARSLRLALVARIPLSQRSGRTTASQRSDARPPSVAMQLIRLEAATQAARELLLRELPPSQRPTTPPPVGWSVDEALSAAPCSERPTWRPARATSDVRPAVHPRAAGELPDERKRTG